MSIIKSISSGIANGKLAISQNADYYIDIFLGILVDIYFCVFTLPCLLCFYVSG